MKKKLIAIIAAFIMCFGTFALTGCGGSDTASDNNGEVIEWSFYSPYGPEDSACCYVWTDLFKQIEEETNGQLKITAYWSGQHPYEGSDMLKVVSDGTAQLAHFYGGYVTSVDPAFGVDTMPLLFPADSDKAWKINCDLWGNFEQNTDGILENKLESDWGASMIHMLPATSQRLFTVGYEAGEIGSLNGHKIRVYSAEFGEFVKALGGTPVTIAGSEVYTALSTNLIDGATTGIEFAKNSGYFDYCDTVNLWEISQSSDGMMVNLDALNALPEDVRTTFLNIMHESAVKPETRELDTCAEILEQFEKDGNTVVTPTDEERAEVRGILEDTVYNKWAESAGDLGKQLLDYVMNYEF